MKPRVVKINIGPDVFKDAKNISGKNGEKCNNCGGYGFTMGIKGEKLPCKDCDETGVKAISNRELQARVIALETNMENLRQAILKDLGFQGRAIPSRLKEKKNG